MFLLYFVVLSDEEMRAAYDRGDDFNFQVCNTGVSSLYIIIFLIFFSRAMELDLKTFW